MARLQRFAHAAAREHNAAHRAVPHEQVLHLRVKAHFSAETPDLLADRAHGLREPVGSDVRLRLEENFLRRAVLGERLQDKKMRSSFVPVFSLPSENVPAPPSPNCTLHSLSSARSCQKRCTAFCRSSTAPPRSTTIGRSPARASRRPANIPAGPKPTTTGRSGSAPAFGIL